ncbi:hypothetical protein D3C85_936030 [compost metagenome]
MSKYGLVREKELFGIIKKKVTNKKLALQFSTELSNTVKIYAGLLNTDHEIWTKYDISTREAISAFNMLGMVQVRPLLLAILDKFEPKKVSIAFKRLISVAVRFQIVGGAGGGTLERIYSDAAKGVSDGSITSIEKILAVFTTLPTDSAFIAAFSVATVSKQALARYYLRMLESGIEGGSGELIPNGNTAQVNLEHVLPVTPSEKWLKEWSADDAKAYQRRLGNMAILSSKINSTIGNDDFMAKKNELAKSSFQFTKSIADFDIWNIEAIESRQVHMAEIAAKVWSIRG